MPQPTVAPEDDMSRSYAQRLGETQVEDAISRARQRVQAPADIEVGPVGAAPEGDTGGAGAAAADIARGVFVESPRAIVTGILGAGQEFTENIMALSDPLAQFLERNIPLGEAPSPEELFGVVTPADPETTTGRAIQGITQFVTGFIPALKATKALQLGTKAGAAGTVAESALAGSLADVAVMDEAEARLSNLVESVPELQNPVTEFLAADPDDSQAEAKFKQAVEGLAIGAGADVLLQSLKFVSKARRAKPSVAEADIEQAAKAEPEVLEHDILTLGDPKAPVFKVDDSIRKNADAFLRGEPTQAPLDFAGNINLSRISGEGDVRDLISRTATLFEDRVTGPVQTNEATIRLANEIAADPDRLRETLTRTGAFNAAEITSLRFLLHESGNQLQVLAKKAAGVGASDVDRFAFERHMAFHGSLLEQTSQAAREAGRALQSFNIIGRGAKEQERAIKELLAQPGLDTNARAAMMSSIDTPEGLNTFVRQSGRARTKDALIEAWINGLLSGPQTHAVNTMSNAMVAVWQIPERMLAAGIRAATGGQGVVAGEAKVQAYGLMRGTVDGIRMFGRALRTGQPSDIFSKIETRGYTPAISAQGFGMENAGLAARAIDLLGEGVRLPGRFLTAEDEFFKGVGYRMELNTRALRKASEEGLEGREAAVRMQEIINNPPEDIRLAAIDAARYQTFTKPLGSTGARFQSVVNSTPALKIVMPFIRTPLNIMKFIGARTPLAPLSSAIRADIAAGGARRDITLARITLGSLVMATTADLAAQGLITGGGPTDSRLKSAMRRTGWQPYSIRIGDEYVSYVRTDPIGGMLGIAADLSDILGQLDQVDAEDVSAAAVMAVSENVVSKTYMSGISDVMEIFAGPTPAFGASAGERYIRRLSGTLIPSAVAQATRVQDPTLRHVESIVDQLKSRIPGYSETLPPRLNLWGDPIVLTGGVGPDIMSPLWRSPVRDSPADEEMVRLQLPIGMPGRTVQDVELDQLQYNRYVELAGNEMKDPGTGLGAREMLEAIIGGKHAMSGEYQAASEGPDGGKSMIIRKVIHAFRQAASAQIMQEFPEIQEQIRQRAVTPVQ